MNNKKMNDKKLNGNKTKILQEFYQTGVEKRKADKQRDIEKEQERIKKC